MTLRRFLLLFITAIAFAPASFAIATSADLSVSKSGPSTVSRSSNVTYNLTVTNNGPDTAASVQLTDPLPPGVTFVSLNQNSGSTFNCTTPAVGNNGTVTCTIASLSLSSATFTLVASIPSNAAEGTQFDNTATVSTATPDPNSGNNSETSSAVVVAQADLAVTKSGPISAAADTDVPFDVTVINVGPDDAMGVSLNDPLPAGMTFVSRNQNNGPAFTCTDPGPGNNGTINCTIALLPAGSSANFTFVAHIAPATPQGTTFTNVVTVSSQTPDPNDENNSSATGVTVPQPQADLLVQKSGPSSAQADTDVSYSITVLNNGPDAADSVSLTDTLPGTMTFVSITQNTGPAFSCSGGATTTCSILSFAAGASATFTLTGHIPPATASGTEFNNIANVSSTTADPNTNNNQSSTTLTVASSDLAIVKTGPGTATAGGTIAWTITVTNNGPDLESSAVLIDNLPAGTTFNELVQNTGPSAACSNPGTGNAGTVSCMFPVLGSGASAQFTLTANISPTFTGTLNNTATVNGQNADPNTNNNSSTAPTTVTTSADLTINKSGPANAIAGTNITYTITVTNSGPSAASNVTMTDFTGAKDFVSESQTAGPTFTCTPPAADGTPGFITCTLASFAPGGSATFSITYRIRPNTTGTLSNTATVSSTTTDPNGTDNTSTTSATVTSSADVSVVKTAPGGATAGTQMTYNITVTNNGPSDATGVTMSDTLPPNTTFVSESQPTGPVFTCTNPPAGGPGTVSCSIATLTAGTTATFTITVQISPAAPVGPSSNTATVSSASDPNAGNNSSTAITQIGAALADLSITKTASPGPYGTGLPVTWTIVVANAGPNAAAGVTVTDVLPAGTTYQSSTPSGACSGTTTITCNAGTLGVGANATFTITAALPATPGPITNTATVSASAANPDPNLGNNTATSTITVISASNIPMISPLTLLLLCVALAVAGAFVQKP